MRPLITGITAATVPGFISAIITRSLMRAVSIAVGTEHHFTLVGSIGIAVIYVVFLLPGCIALAWSRSWWPWLLFAAGAGGLLFEALAIGLDETSAAGEMTAVRWGMLALVLAAMLVTYVVHFTVTACWARHGTVPDLRRSKGLAKRRDG